MFHLSEAAMVQSTTAAHLLQRVTSATGITSHTRRAARSITSIIEVAVGMAREVRMDVLVASQMVAQRETRAVATIAPQEALVVLEYCKPLI